MKQTAFTRKKDFGKEAREAQWAHAQRTLHGLHPTDTNQSPLPGGTSNRDLGEMAEQAKRRAEIARYVLDFSKQIIFFTMKITHFQTRKYFHIGSHDFVSIRMGVACCVHDVDWITILT